MRRRFLPILIAAGLGGRGRAWSFALLGRQQGVTGRRPVVEHGPPGAPALHQAGVPARWRERLSAPLRMLLAAPYLVFAVQPARPPARVRWPSGPLPARRWP